MKVLVVDDHGLFREGVCLLLQRMGIASSAIYEAGNATGGLALAKKHIDLGLILLDINLPDLAGESTVRAFRLASLSASLVLLSAIDDMALARRCMNEGAQGFIHKSTPADKFMAALRLIMEGHSVWIDSQWKEVPQPLSQAPIELTGRQREVLACLCLGWSNKEIARDLGISDNTVRIHVAAILQALGARTRSEAIVLAGKLGLTGG
ncbi:MAG: response regulator transcription factor [Methylococcaceae bacterium]|nr:response regulator transcription factor [Methylococcaceae bacterium]